MFHNYLITALRNVTRHKLYSFINIAGLTVGLTCAIFIILFVRDELSYDRWIPGGEHLYRVETTFLIPGQPPLPLTFAPFAATEAMLAEIPEVKAIAHLETWQLTIAEGNRQFTQMVDVVNPEFFNVIKLPLLHGDSAQLFTRPESAVISAAMAVKLFGSDVAIGKTILVGGGSNAAAGSKPVAMLVTGVMRDLPRNTQLAGDVFIPNTSSADPMSPDKKQSWIDAHGWGFVQLAPGADPNQVLTTLKALIDRSVDPFRLANIPMAGSQVVEPRLTPFYEDHLSTDKYGSLTPPGSWTTVYGFIGIGVLILMVACFNFTNLATASSIIRAREISLRKVMGANRRQLMFQFLGESVLTALVSLILALSFVEILLPAFNRILDKQVAPYHFEDWRLSLALLGITVFAGLMGGVYPALVLSGFKPALVLKSNRSGQSGSGLVRSALVVLQFAVSIGLAIAVAVLFHQISFARAVDLGFDRNGVVVVDGSYLSSAKRKSLGEALRNAPEIESVAISGAVPFRDQDHNVPVHLPGSSATAMMRWVAADPDFPHLYEIHLVAGRPLSDSRARDHAQDDGSPNNVLINETAAKRFGSSPQDAIGKTMIQVSPARKAEAELTVVGVIADFKIEGTKRPVTATFYRFDPEHSPYISVRVRPGQMPAALSFIDRTWRSFAPSMAIQRFSLNDGFDRQFLADEQQGGIFGLFVGIAIFIASLGLFGLAAFSTERRVREIGLRKTFGARTRDIILLLLWQFSIPVLIANLIAWPVAYFYLRHWLEGYAYRIALSPLYFIGAGLAALVIAWITVIAHAARVARANPIHALRYE